MNDGDLETKFSIQYSQTENNSQIDSFNDDAAVILLELLLYDTEYKQIMAKTYRFIL